MAEEDDEKTVFGGPAPRPLPGRPVQGQADGDPWGRGASGSVGRPSGSNTVFPVSGAASGRSEQAGPGASPFGASAQSDGGTWLGHPASSQGRPGYTSSYSGPSHDPQQIGRAYQGNRGFFPDIGTGQPTQAARAGPRIPLHQALQVRDLGGAASSNPLLAAAASLLILLGRLRTGMVEMQVAPLMEHVTREIDRFERNALVAGVGQHQVLVAKYALSGTADDIVQNLPGSDRGNWQQYSMVARFFHKRDSGVGFFQEAEKAMQAPAQNYNLLELMLVCLSLGFEGQFRTMPNGAAELSRIRSAIYESLRRVNPRPDEDISVMWTPVVQDRGRRFAAIPLPALLGAGAAALLGVFAVFATLINRDGAVAAEAMRDLHRTVPVIQIDRTVSTPYVAEIPQLERVREAFAAEIADGRMEGVEAKGNYIAIRVGNLQLFDSGAVTVKPAFNDLAARIADVLNAEGGPILIEGHTDNVPLSGRGQFKDNYQLSAVRAESVADVLGPLLTDAARIRIEGRGEDDPVADNATPEGQSANRRVEILLAREGTYDAAPAPAATETED